MRRGVKLTIGLLCNSKMFKCANFKITSHRSDYISSRVPRYPFITMRNSNLDKYYLRLKSEEYLANEVSPF